MASAVKMHLPSADDLFSTQAERDDINRERVVDIPLDQIDEFPEHPFQVRQDDAMQAMVESVQSVGIQTPLIVRPKEDGRYEVISGHRRKFAATLAEVNTLPCIVREMTRDEAIIAMVDANLQREVILPSEKAFSYKMKLEAMKRQAGRPANNCVPVGHNFEGKRSRELLAENSPDSNTQIQRFIRLTALQSSLLQMVDDSKIAFRPAVELSYLPENEQAALLDTIEAEAATPSLAQAQKMKRFSQEGKLTPEVIQSVMMEEKPNQVEQFKMPKAKISKYFPPGTPAQKIEDTIVKALELYRHRQRDRSER